MSSVASNFQDTPFYFQEIISYIIFQFQSLPLTVTLMKNSSTTAILYLMFPNIPRCIKAQDQRNPFFINHDTWSPNTKNKIIL